MVDNIMVDIHDDHHSNHHHRQHQLPIIIERTVKDILIRHIDITKDHETIQINITSIDIALSVRN